MKSELRVIQFQEPEQSQGIHEVYSDDEGNLVSFASQPITLKWTGGTMAVLNKLDEIKAAIVGKRWLTPKDFGLPQ